MLRIVLPSSLERLLSMALKQAGQRETGGILMGEFLDSETYRVCDLTVQDYGGTPSSFVRALPGVPRKLKRFFRRTKHDYTRFNYLGEWHSHPSYPTIPSPHDSETMWDIVQDPRVGANFAVLLIVRLGECSQVEGDAYLYTPMRCMCKVSVVKEEIVDCLQSK